MPKYRITAPDGKSYIVTAPEGASQEDVLAYAKSHYGSQQSSVPDYSAQWTPEQRAQVASEQANADQLFGQPTVVGQMSAPQRFGAGLGKSFVEQGRGLYQTGLDLARSALSPTTALEHAIGQQSPASDYVNKQLAASKEAEANARSLDKPLMATPAGLVGNIAGYAIPIAAGGVGLRGSTAGAMFAPETVGGSVLQGAALGATQPLATGEGEGTRALNTAIGAGAGLAGGVLPRVIGAGLRGAKAALIQPFTKGGQEAIAAQAIREAASNPQALMQAAPSAIPGVTRTLAEESLDPGVSQLQRQYAQELAMQGATNDAARVAAIRAGFGGADEAAQAAAKAQAERAAMPLLKQATTSGAQVKTEPVVALADKLIANAKGNPAVQSTLGLVRDQLASGSVEGEPVREVAQLYNTRKYIDDLLKGRAGGDTNAAKAATSELLRIKSMLDNQISKASPEFKQYLKTYIKGMAPANQAAIGQRLLNTASAVTNPVTGERTLTAAAFSRATNSLDQLAQVATGFKKASAQKILTPEQTAIISSVRDDLSRLNSANNLGGIAGSRTSQNLATQNALRQFTRGLGTGNMVINTTPVKTISSIMERAYSAFKIPARIHDNISAALADPSYAREILAKLPAYDRATAEQFIAILTGPGGNVMAESRQK